MAAREAPQGRWRARRCGRALAAVGALVVGLTPVAGCADAPGGRPSRAAPNAVVLGEQVTRSTPATTPPTSTTSVTTSTTTSTTPPPTASPVATTCADALAYLAAHQAPGFTDRCADASAFGHLGVTCVDQPGMCPGARIVHIACPAAFVYMNEAHNSWVLVGQRSGIDPYGQGTAAQRAACASHR